MPKQQRVGFLCGIALAASCFGPAWIAANAEAPDGQPVDPFSDLPPLPKTEPQDSDSPFIATYRAGRMSDRQAADAIKARAESLASACRLTDRYLIERDIIALKGINAANPARRQAIDEALNTATALFYGKCYSDSLRDAVQHSLINSCHFDFPRRRLEELKALAEAYRREAEAIKGASGFTNVPVSYATEQAKYAEQDYLMARGDYNARVEACRKPKKESKKSAPAKKLKPLGASPAPAVAPALPAGSNADPCRHPVPSDKVASCNLAGPFIGRWASPDGGAIALTLEADGTVTGRIASVSKRMKDHGYASGMVILRGWKPASTSLTWSALIRDGEFLLGGRSYCKPTEACGQAKWEKGGVIFIEVKDPTRLMLPASLENRLSNYQPFRRSGN